MRKINRIAVFLLAGFVLSCGDDNEPNEVNPGVYFDVALSPQTVEIDPLNADKDFFVLTLGRDESKADAVLQLPITVIQADEGLTIPQAVTFAAGEASAELIITVSLSKLEDADVLAYSLEFDEKYFDPYSVKGFNRFDGEVFRVLGAVTPENIATYVQPSNVRSVEAFMNEGTARYNITLMSPRLEAWSEDYREKIPEFTHYSILLPRSTYQMSFAVNYTTGGFWYQGPQNTIANDGQGIIPMTDGGANPLTDVTFDIPRSSGANPVPDNFNHPDYWGGVQSFFRFLHILTVDSQGEPIIPNGSAGFTIISDRDDETVFWFRSKAEPNDWFKCERYE